MQMMVLLLMYTFPGTPQFPVCGCYSLVIRTIEMLLPCPGTRCLQSSVAHCPCRLQAGNTSLPIQRSISSIDTGYGFTLPDILPSSISRSGSRPFQTVLAGLGGRNSGRVSDSGSSSAAAQLLTLANTLQLVEVCCLAACGLALTQTMLSRRAERLASHAGTTSSTSTTTTPSSISSSYTPRWADEELQDLAGVQRQRMQQASTLVVPPPPPQQLEHGGWRASRELHAALLLGAMLCSLAARTLKL